MSSFPPPDLTPADLALERSSLDGAVIGGIAYGVHVAVFAECLWRIYPRSFKRGTANDWYLVAFTIIMFAMGTLNFACNTRMTELMFIDNRAFPGGPMAWFITNYADGVNTAGNAGYIIANFFADGLLLWRCYVVWNTVWILVFPLLVFMASTALSILTLFQASRPDASLWTNTTIQISLPYFSISIALNVLLTLLLVGRLLYMSEQAKRTIGRDHAATYTSIVAMLVESAVPYAVAGLLFIITYARNSNVQNIMLPILSQIMCISPEVIILRVALGRAVTSKTYARTAGRTPTGGEVSMKFRSQPSHQNSSFQLSTVDHTTLNGSYSSKSAYAREDV
ncbi:hypothetical protein C8Q80DRAFT_1101643 [Daedaleopsis nitida]|nr:hypothetical protein C8Q80DRAFT_1101643 [Daedaleopsis nitida]